MPGKRVTKREVEQAAAHYGHVRSLYGDHDLSVSRALGKWQELQAQYEKQTGKSMYPSRNPPQPGESPAANLRNALAILYNMDDAVKVLAKDDISAIEARIIAALETLEGRPLRHRNPPGLVVWHNPPMATRRVISATSGPRRVVGVIGDEVHRVFYRNADGRDYVHEFEDAAHVLMFAAERGERRDIIITHEHGKPLWEEM